MARSPRTAAAPPPIPPTIPTRPSRRRQSITSTAPSTPFTAGTPDTSQPFSGFTPSTAGPSRSGGGGSSRSHALRSVGTAAAERAPCPFPADWGGREKCGTCEEDEADEVLMAACATLAILNNRACSPEDLARISVENGWIRPPTAAVEPAAPFNASFRNHFKQCEKATPPRQPLLSKYQLTGSVAEQIFQPALHPDAFAGGARPKGTVYFLSAVGKSKWKNPFHGIDTTKAPAKKPGPVKKAGKEKKEKVKEREGSKGKTKIAPAPQPETSVPPVKLRLFLNPGAAAAKEKEVKGEKEETEGLSVPVSRNTSTSPTEIPTKTLAAPRRKVRRPSRPFDTSDDSDTSDTDEEGSSVCFPPRMNGRPARRPAPVPIAISGSPRFSHLTRLPQGSPFKELFFPTSPHASASPFPCPPSTHTTPFPTHSLDNTLWTVRTGAPDSYTFEDSSSSSDEEMRDPDWGQTSGILIRADDEEVPVWSGETEDEAKIKEATDALRVLFPMVNADESMETDNNHLELNRLDNDRHHHHHRPFSSSDASSIAESSSTAAPLRHHLSTGDIAHIPLNTWISNSSPVSSPILTVAIPLPSDDTPPAPHLTVTSPLEQSMEMDIDDDHSWLDESGEGPIRADPDETLSDSEVISQPGGDILSPEQDRRRTAEWAKAAAVSTVFRVKEEIVDYPSPGLTDCDDIGLSPPPHDISRASSAETQDREDGIPMMEDDEGEYESTCCGPESMTVEDVDGLYNPLPSEKTPARGGKKGRGRTTGVSHRRTLSSGKIGVAVMTCTPRNLSPVKGSGRTRSLRPSTTRRRKSESDPIIHPPTPPLTDGSLDTSPPRQSDDKVEWLDAIGTADLDLAVAEAEAKEEERRKLQRQQSEDRHALREAYRKQIGSSPDGTRPFNWGESSFSDLASAGGSATDLSMYGAGPSGAMSPMALQSMSMLSLKDMPNSVDPRALRSPPIRMDVMGTMGMGMGMEEMMGLQGIPGMMDVTMDGSTAIPAPDVTQPPPPPPAKTTKPPVVRTSTPTTAPPHAPPRVSTAAPVAIAPKAKPAITAPPPPAAPQPKPVPKTDNHHIAVPLCNGVRISVISMIPVYFLKHMSKFGEITVIRRIDSDYVNATSLLLALGLPKNKHYAIISPLSNALPSSKEVLEPADPEMGYESGVTGLWIRLQDARFLRDRFKGHADCAVWALLNDDIVEKFVAIIKNQSVQHIHTSKDNFGSNFQATPRAPSTDSTRPDPSAARAKTLPNPSAIRKPTAPTSVPGRPTSAASAGPPPRPATVGPGVAPRASLVRPAPTTAPDECPQPKRRRPTISGPTPPTPSTIAKPPPLVAKPPTAAAVPIAKAGPPVAKPPTMIPPTKISQPTVQNTSVSAHPVQPQAQGPVVKRVLAPPVVNGAINRGVGLVPAVQVGTRPIAPAPPSGSARPTSSTPNPNPPVPIPRPQQQRTNTTPKIQATTNVTMNHAKTSIPTPTPTLPSLGPVLGQSSPSVGTTRRTTRASVGGEGAKVVG